MEDTYIFVLVLLTCVSAKPVSRMLRMDDDLGTQVRGIIYAGVIGGHEIFKGFRELHLGK